MFDGLDQFLAFIGAVVCLVVVIGAARIGSGSSG